VPFEQHCGTRQACNRSPDAWQRLGGAAKPLVVVDYAHTPDALEKTLVALKDVARASGGRLVAVFGAEAERDPGSGPLMGAVASRHATRSR